MERILRGFGWVCKDSRESKQTYEKLQEQQRIRANPSRNRKESRESEQTLETPLAGTNPWLEQNPRWHKPLAGTSSRLEQPSTKKYPALTGKTLRLEPPPAWKKPWPGYNPWLEQTSGWKKPCAGKSPWLETAPRPRPGKRRGPRRPQRTEAAEKDQEGIRAHGGRRGQEGIRAQAPQMHALIVQTTRIV